MKIKAIFAAGLTVALSSTVHAGFARGDLDGVYRPLVGSVQTLEVGTMSQPEQLGELVLYFERENWDQLPRQERRRIRRFLVIYGQVRGLLDSTTFLSQHVISNNSRSGILYTENDFTIPETGDPMCSTGVPIEGIETVNVMRGAGEYSGLTSGQLMLSAHINNCPGSEDFGKNNFTLTTDGYLEFQTP